MRVFRDQINLIFFIFDACQNCTDLLNGFVKLDKFDEFIDDPRRTESRSALEKAFETVDKYGKGVNVSEKMKSYINRIIEINNNTILTAEKKRPKNMMFRLVSKMDVHSNMSIMNTFLPALAHSELNPAFATNDLLINAMKILTGNKDSKDLVGDEKSDIRKPFASYPSLFDFKDDSFAIEIMNNIEKIKDDTDLFGFPKYDLSRSLCDEIGSFVKNFKNKRSYRSKIWKMIKEKEKPKERPTDYMHILSTLFPLFEEYDKNLSESHLFFKWENEEEIPSRLEGLDAATYFLKSYEIGGKSLFQIIDST